MSSDPSLNSRSWLTRPRAISYCWWIGYISMYIIMLSELETTALPIYIGMIIWGWTSDSIFVWPGVRGGAKLRMDIFLGLRVLG
jgi:hypothetical protein